MAFKSAVFLIGFMGSGKTTLGKKLAAKLSAEFIDLDEAICEKYSAASIKSLIEKEGFDFFREAESKTLKSLSVESKVISTGGGTPCYFDNMPWMKSNGTVVYLNVKEEIIFSRLRDTDLSERPLLKDLDKDGLRKFIHEKLQERLPFYEQAHITFNPAEQKLEELLEELKK